MMRLYAMIEKVAKRADGTVDVFGFASSETVDADGEVITADAMRNALPDYMRFANVREMHDATKAAGTAIDAAVQADGKTYFAVHVVDPIAVLKVESGVYKGFSIAGRVLERQGHKITQLKLIEVSLVDRPANPDAVFTCYKCEADADESLLPTCLAVEHQPLKKTQVTESTTPSDALEIAKTACRTIDEALATLWCQPDPPEGVDEETNADALLKRLHQAESALQDAQNSMAEQAKRIAELENTPSVAKSILKVVDKADDTLPSDITSVATNAREAILKAHRQGGFRIA